MFIGFLEYVISQIVQKPGYIPGDYVGSNDLFDGGEGDSTWRNFQVRTRPPFSLRNSLAILSPLTQEARDARMSCFVCVGPLL